VNPVALLLLLLAAAPDVPAPDLPAPLGQLDHVLERPQKSAGAEQVVDLTLRGCDHAVPLNLSRMLAGTAFAMQQMLDWARQNLPQGLPPPAVLEALGAGVRDGTFAATKACKALPREVAAAVKLCPGAAPDQAWLLAGGRAAALVRWSAGSGKDRCLPKVTGVLFDAKGVARVRYDADFGGAAAGALDFEGCQVTFTYDATNEVFHAGVRGCKGS
jgi:hypothetical protein